MIFNRSLALIAFILLLASALFAQNQAHFFKVPKVPAEAQPNWVQAMYSENPNVLEVVDLYDAYYAENEFVKNIDTQNFKFWIKSVDALIDSDGLIRDANSIELRRVKENFRRTKQEAASRRSSSTWQTVGPFDTYRNNGSLEVRATQVNIFCMAVAPSNHDVLYSVSEEGGIFKSTDRGLSWNAVSLLESFIKGQDIKVHPSDPDVVYFGTNNDIYKTIDGGASWELIHTASGVIEQLHIHSAQHNMVYAATADGLLFSTNSGGNWSTLRPGRCWDIEPHATDPNVLYLSVHNASEKRAEIFKSVNGGATWALKDNNWYVPTTFSEASDIGCKIGVTPADPDRVYACLIGNSKSGDNGWIGVYYSLDGADSWVNADGIDGGPYASGSDMNTNWFYAGYESGYHQGWYNFDLDVSHTDPDKIWVGTIWVMESGNRGANLEYIRGTRNLAMHADVQDIDVEGGDVWFTSDGGINYSDDEMATVEIRHSGIHASDFWGFSQGWNEDTWTGGRYHNGDATYHENYGLGNTVFQGGAEAATGYINPMDNRRCYYTDISDIYTPDQLNEAAVGTLNISRYPNESYWALNSSELEFDPRYADHLFLGNENVFYGSTDGGATFDALHSFPFGSRVLEIEISRADPSRIYCLVRYNSLGRIYRSNDGGHSFAPTAVIPASNTNGLGFTLSGNDPDNIWVSTRQGSNNQKVYQSINGGVSWINRSTPTLDGHSLEDIVFQYGTDDLVYLSTQYDFFYWNAASSDWESYSQGLPLVTQALKAIPFYRDGKIRQSSGRGIWEVDLATESMPLAQPLTRTDVIRCSRDTVLFEDYSVLNHEGATWQWSFSPAPTYISDVNSRSPKVVFSANGPYDVTLTVTDLAGNTDTKTVESMIVVDSQCEPEAGRGHSMRLTANGDIAQTPDFGLENIEEFTMSVWVKPEAIQNIYTGIIISDNSACGLNFRNNNEIGFHWDNSQWWWDSGLFAPVGEWTHLALVITPSETTIYVNGESSVNTANNPLVDMTSFKFGSYHGWGGRNYNGEMDELCLWDRALSSDEIRESRHLTRTGADSFSDGLLAYYQFNEIGESEVLDKVGSRHAQMNAGAFLQASNAPIGGGLSDRLVLSASGVYAFPDTQTEITLSSGVGARDVVVSRWDTNDVEAPDGEELVSNVWLINNYGDEFNTASTIRLSTLGGVYSGSASDSRLLSRPQNAGEGEWTERCSAATKTLSQFTFDSSCGFVDSGQFTIIAPASCPGDLDGDGEVNVNDFILFNSAFGTSCSPCNADLDGDGLVGVNDFLFLNSFFGSTCN